MGLDDLFRASDDLNMVVEISGDSAVLHLTSCHKFLEKAGGGKKTSNQTSSTK